MIFPQRGENGPTTQFFSNFCFFPPQCQTPTPIFSNIFIFSSLISNTHPLISSLIITPHAYWKSFDSECYYFGSFQDPSPFIRHRRVSCCILYQYKYAYIVIYTVIYCPSTTFTLGFTFFHNKDCKLWNWNFSIFLTEFFQNSASGHPPPPSSCP